MLRGDWVLGLGLLVSGAAMLGMFVAAATGNMTMFVGACMVAILMSGAAAQHNGS